MITLVYRAGVWCLMLAALGFLLPGGVRAGGTWAPLASGPPVGVNNCLLLSDGTVLGMNGAGQCVKLTPDIHGSYVNGTWTSLPTMNYSRLFFSSDLLTNGNVYVAGGEYGDADGYAELYDTLANTWTLIQPGGLFLSDACSKILPSGNVLQSDSQSGIYLYNTVANTIAGAGTTGTGDMNESCWVRMPNDNILAVNGYGQNSQHYVPALNAWYSDNNVPVPVFGYGGELGPAFVLPNGNVIQIGATTNTAIYTPGGSLTSAGTWVAGPGMLFPLVTNTANSSLVYGGAMGAVDAPAAMMANGNILCALGIDTGFNGTEFYEYSSLSNSFTQVSAPYGSGQFGWDGQATFATSMLDLPDGNVLFVDGQNSGSLYVYTPAGSPLAAGKPVINSLTENLNGTYHLTGVGLNGISAGAAYGDDEQMDSSYPLVRMTNSVSGNVYYARTYGWSSTTIQNPNPVTTEFTVPAGLPAGTYSLVVVANGNPSAPTNFTYAPPAAPTGLTGTAGNMQTTLSWNPVSGATSYNVKLLTTISPPQYTIVTTVTGPGCTNVGLVNGMDYLYVVSAVSAGGESTNSTPLFLVPFGPPSVPTGVTATAIPQTLANPQINLAWLASYGATNYNIKRSLVHNGPYTNVAGSVNPFYVDTNLLNGKTYYYVVSAVSAGGESSNSTEASATIPLVTNTCLPVTAADVVGSQVTFMAAFNGSNYAYQWQKIVGGVTNPVTGATNTTLTLPNLQLTDTAAYVLRASNSLGVAVSTPGALTVSSVPAPVNNVITAYAAQTGAGSANPDFVPTWTLASGSLIAGQSPSSVGSGNFSYSTSVLTDGTYGWLIYNLANPSPTQITGGSGAGESVTYTLSGSVSGYTLTNIVVYGGWCDAGRDSQSYTVYYSTVSAPTNFILLGSANYNPANPGGIQSATRATFTPANGVLATNVAAVMFDLTTPAGENGYEGYSEIQLFGSPPPPLQIAPYLATNTLPVTAADVVGSQVTFMAAFSGTNPIAYQWQKIKSGVTNNIAGATNTILTLTNLQLIDTASYQLQASNVLGVAVSTPSPLTVSSVSGAVNNVITSVAAQTGISGAASYVPTWTVAPGSLILGQSPNSVGAGSFNIGGAGPVSVLTDGSFGALNSVPGNGSSPDEITGGTAASGAGQSVIYLLTGSGSGYNLTNIVVYGGWGDGGRDQQAYTIYYSKIATPTTFVQLTSVNYNPANPLSSLSATRATLVPASGALATNVAAVKFDFTTPAGKNGYEGYSEIELFGSATPVAPSINLTAPANNAAYTAPATVNLAATVTTNSSQINGVNFYFNNTNLIAQVTNSPYTYAWTNVSAASYGLTARVIYNTSSFVTSSVVNITVTNPPPPAIPTILSATATNTQVMLSWTASTGATSYNVKSPITNGGPYNVITNLTSTSYTNFGLTAGVTYYYVVSALNLGGESSNSLQASATPPPVPPLIVLTAPTNNAAYAALATVNLAATVTTNYNQINGVNFYFNSTNLIAQVTNTPYTYAWNNVSAGSYSVSAQLIYNTSSFVTSSIANITITNPPPPAIPTILSATATNTQVMLSWTASVGAASYNVKSSITNGGPYNVITNLTSTIYTNFGLTAGVTYYYVVSALNLGGESSNSIQASATPPPVPPLIVLTSPTDSTAYTALAAVNLAATVTTNYNQINGVNFYFNNTNLIAQVTNAPYTYAWNNVSAGSYALTAQVIYNTSSFVTSSVANITVTNPPPPPVPTILSAIATNTQVMLAWTASAGATSYNVKSSTTNGGAYSIITNLTSTSYTNCGLTAGVTYYYVVSALNLGGESSNSIPASATPEALPPPWVDADVGSVGLSGFASYSNGVFTVNGSGTDISGSADAFNYVYQPVTGNCDIIARVTGVPSTSPGAKAGIMIRETLATDSADALVDLTPSNGLEFIWRPTDGGSSAATNAPSLAAPYWVQLVRNKDTFTAYSSPDGTNWTKVAASQTIPMAANVYAGLAGCAQNNSALGTATLDNVTFPTPPTNVYTPPQMTTSWQSGGTFTLQFPGVNDLNYTVQTSTNLTVWTSIYTNALTATNGGVFSFQVLNATDPAAFYRIEE